MRSASLPLRAIRLAAGAALATVGLGVPQVAAAAPSSAASSGVGWIRLAHFSPNTPAVDVYLYSFGNPNAQLVLQHVSYGTVSPFEQVAAGEYTVAMRAAGAASSSKPVLSTAVDIAARHAYTVAGVGPASGIRLEVIPDELTTPPGKALVRIIQASMQEDTVTVTAGGTTLASNLKFANVTSFVAVNPGTWSVRAAGASESVTTPITLAAGTIHTIVVLDEPGKLVLDDLLDAAGSKVAPAGGPRTGYGGSAARPGATLVPWAAAVVAGLVITAAGIAMLTRAGVGLRCMPADVIGPPGEGRDEVARGGRKQARRHASVTRRVQRPWSAAATVVGLFVIGLGAAGLYWASHTGRSATPIGRPPVTSIPVGHWAAAPPAQAQAVPRPIGLVIPAIGVRTKLIRLGLTAAHTLQVPSNVSVAGWYTGSPRPGGTGSAVIAGHIDSATGPAVFFRLRELRRGDLIYVQRRHGKMAVFKVTTVRTFPKSKFPTAAVYGPVPNAQLRLITCGGTFDWATGRYLSNVVVFAVLE